MRDCIKETVHTLFLPDAISCTVQASRPAASPVLPQGGTMRAQTMVIGLVQAALLMACDRSEKIANQTGKPGQHAYSRAASPVALGR